MDKLLGRFENYMRGHALAAEGSRILVAVSGGVDSMVLLSLLVRSGYRIGVAHCNFQLRGAESEEDEVLVEKEAAKYDVPFYNMRFDTTGEMERTGDSVQMAARRLRYEWFAGLCASEGYDTLAIAHHADDSIETFFINLFRGTGLKGLTGISVVNGRIIRPLMFASRKDILDYAHQERIPFREDSSNRSTKYLRNKIRLGIVPRLREINPKFTEIMAANVERLTDAQLFIDRSVDMLRQQVEEHREGLVYIHTERIDSGLPTNFVIYELLNRYGFKGDVVDSLCKSLNSGNTGRRFYSRDHVAYADRRSIIVAPLGESDTCDVEVGRDMRRSYCGNSVLYFDYSDIDNIETLAVPENVALLDADKLAFPLRVRRWQEGDWMVPFGMAGRKKISDVLVDMKVPLAEKRRQFVLLNGDDIIWLVGRRTDDRYRVGPGTENVLKITREIV